MIYCVSYLFICASTTASSILLVFLVFLHQQKCNACVKHQKIQQLDCMRYSALTARATYNPTMVSSRYFDSNKQIEKVGKVWTHGCGMSPVQAIPSFSRVQAVSLFVARSRLASSCPKTTRALRANLIKRLLSARREWHTPVVPQSSAG